MRLVILSNMTHHYRDGEIVGHGSTAREIDHLAELFDEVVHVACLREEDAPASALPYSARNVRLIPVPPSGGRTVAEKLNILRLFPHYARTIVRALRDADAVHVRCPANISLLAILLLATQKHPRLRWIKYAGNWQPYDGEAWSYKFQRWWLERNFARAQVTVNGEWPQQPDHVRSFLNPCLSVSELADARELTQDKQLTEPIRLIFVGQLVQTKGVFQLLSIVRRLTERHMGVSLDVIGDGPERAALEQQVQELGIRDEVHFHGWVPRTELGTHLSQGHFMLLPSRSEGWPKVLSEAMAYGVVPLASNVSCIPQYLGRFGTGRALAGNDTTVFAGAIQEYFMNPAQWKAESENGVRAAQLFSYDHYLAAVRWLLHRPTESGQPLAKAQAPRWITLADEAAAEPSAESEPQ